MTGKRLLTILTAAAVLLLPRLAPALEHEWSRVDLNNSRYEDKYFMDLASFVVMDKEVVFWGRYLSPEGVTSAQKIAIDCALSRYMVRESSLRDGAGKLMEEDTTPTGWLPVSAASFYGYLKGLVCVRGAPKPFSSLTSIGVEIYNVRSLRGYDD